MAVLVALNLAVLTNLNTMSGQVQEANVRVTETQTLHQTASKRLQEVQKEKLNIDASLKEERTKVEGIQAENESLKVSLQAKKDAEAKALQLASTPKPAAAVTVTGDKASWLAASGIPEGEWGYVDSIVSRESGWNPNAVNASSGACGLGQQLPCGKWAGAWNDPVAALVAQHGYVKERYGGYAGAVAFWNQNHWY